MSNVIKYKIMKINILTYICIVLITIIGCSEDHGNYSYSKLNKVEINLLEELYTIDQFENIEITPELSFTQNKELTNLSYEWKINNKVVSDEKVLNVEVTEEAGNYKGLLRVTDEDTGIEYFHEFNIKVVTAFTNVLFVLSEKENGEAMLSFQRRDKENAPLIHNAYKDANPKQGFLGTKPKQIFYNRAMKTYFGVLCKEGDKKLTLIDPKTMKLSSIHNENTIRGGFSGEFSPEFINLHMTGVIAGGNKLYLFNFMNNESIYRPMAGDFEFANWAGANFSLGNMAWVSYDNKSEEFKFLEPIPGGDIAFDKITTFDPVINTSGQKFVCADYVKSGWACPEKRAILYNAEEDKAYFYSLNLNYKYGESWEILMVNSASFIMAKEALVRPTSICEFGQKSLYWFIANGNKVSKIHGNGGDSSDIFTAPQGNVTCMQLDPDDERLFIATHDGTNGYIYVYNTITNKLVEEMTLDAKVVHMLPQGKWTF